MRTVDDAFGPSLDELFPQVHELGIPDGQRRPPLQAAGDPLQEAVSLLEHPAIGGQRPTVAPDHLDQHLVEESAPVFRAALDQVQILRPEERGLDFSGQVHSPPRAAIDPDRFDGPFRGLLDLDRDLQPARALLDDRLHRRFGRQGADQVRLSARAGRGG